MDALEEGDKVRHLVTGEEGIFKKALPWTVGTNHGEGHLVEVSGKERLWLTEETLFIERPTKQS